MSTELRFQSAMGALNAIKPLGERTNSSGAAAPAFSFKAATVATTSAAAAAAPANHFAKKRSSELGDSIDNRNGGDGDGRFESEDWDPTGPMEKASEEELAKRKVIRRARRRKKGAAPAEGPAPAKGLFGSKAPAAAAPAPAFQFKPAAPDPSPAPAFSFGAPEASEAATESPAKPAFKFGGDTTTADKPAFSFGGAAAASAAPAFKFSAPPGAAPAEASDDDEEAEPEEEEKGTIQPGAGEESETTEREHLAKLYRLRSGEWVELGKGQLKLNRHGETGKRRLLMRAGLRVVLNSPLFEGQSAKVQGAGVLFTAIETVDGKQTTSNMMLKVNKAHLAALAAAICAGNDAPAAEAAAPEPPKAEDPSPAQQMQQEEPEEAKEPEEEKPAEPAAPAFSFGGAAKPAAKPAAAQPFVFKAPDAAAVMPATSCQPVFSFGAGPSKLVQPSEAEMDEVDAEETERESSDEEYVQEEQEEEEDDEEEEEEEPQEEEAAEEQGEAVAETEMETGAAASGAEVVGGSLAQLTSLKARQSEYRTQLEDYQTALEVHRHPSHLWSSAAEQLTKVAACAGQARREGRLRGQDGLREEHERQPAPAAVRRGHWHGHDRQRADRPLRRAPPAAQHRHRQPGQCAVQHVDQGEHHVRHGPGPPAGADGRGDLGHLRQGQRHGVHQLLPQQALHQRRRARRQALGRPEAAHRDRAGDDPQAHDPAPGRGHVGA